MGISQGNSFDPATSHRKFAILATDVGELAYVAQLMKSLSREAPSVDLLVMEASLDEYELLLEGGEADLDRKSRGFILRGTSGTIVTKVMFGFGKNCAPP